MPQCKLEVDCVQCSVGAGEFAAKATRESKHEASHG